MERECKIQNSNRIQLGITKKALAERIGVQRTSLSRELAKMKADGLIDFDDKTISLLK
jgi:CRP-like cAMP-binding protein